MADETMLTPEAEIEALLAEERAALLSGRLDRLEDFARRKAALVSATAASGGWRDPAQARRIGLAAERNQTLLAAAAEGVRSALRRIGELKAMEAGKGTYAADGRRETSALPPRVTRRF